MTKHGLVLTGATALVLGCSSRDVPATQGVVVRLDSSASCSSCSIVIDSLLTLERVVSDGRSAAIARDAHGSVFLIDRRDGLLKAFRSNGRPISTVGQKGGGPGQYETVRNLFVGRDGSIQILDPVLGRRTVFEPRGRFLRSSFIRLVPGIDNPAILRRDSQLIVNVSLEPVGDSISTVQCFDSVGHISHSIEWIRSDLPNRWRQERLLWERTNGDLLVGQPYSPVIRVYNPSFEIIGTITLVSEYFTGERKKRPSDGVFDSPYTPRLQAMWEDSLGMLWLVVYAPSPSWTPHRAVADFTGTEYRGIADRPRITTIISVIDLQRARLVATERREGTIGAVFGGGLLEQNLVSAAGEPGVRISQIQLKQ